MGKKLRGDRFSKKTETLNEGRLRFHQTRNVFEQEKKRRKGEGEPCGKKSGHSSKKASTRRIHPLARGGDRSQKKSQNRVAKEEGQRSAKKGGSTEGPHWFLSRWGGISPHGGKKTEKKKENFCEE